MLQIKTKKGRKSEVRYSSIIVLIIQMGFILYSLSHAPFFSSYRAFTSSAEEPSPLTNNNSEEDLAFDKEQSQIEKYLKDAKSFFENGRFKEAIKLWNDVLAIEPDNQQAKKGIELAEEKIAKIKDFFGKERNKIIEKYLNDAQSFFENGRYEEAIKLWNDVLAIEPDNQQAKKGIELAEEKIAKIKDFFGKDVFIEQKIHTLSLKNCLEIAEESSLQFQIAKEQIDLAKIKVWEARRAFFPSLILSWTETKGIRTGGKIEGIEYGVEGKQPAYYSGELWHTLGQSKVNLDITEENYDKLALDLYYGVAEAYYSLVKAKKSLQYTKTLYEESEPYYEMAKKKHEMALVPDIEHLDSESKFNKIYYKNISVENDFEIARLTLEQKLNIERTGCIDVEVDIPKRIIDKDLNACLFLTIENRPDLKISELTVKSADYEKKISQSKELPHVDLAGHYKKASEVYRDEAGLDPKKKWYAGLEVNWPFFGSTGTYSLYKREDPATLSTYPGSSESKGTSVKLGILDNVKQFSTKKEADISYARAKDDLNEMRKKAIREVKDAFYAYKKARIQMESATIQKEFGEKETKILKVKHSLGEANLSDLFDSFIHQMDANEAYFEAEKDLNISIAALNKAIGLRDYF